MYDVIILSWRCVTGGVATRLGSRLGMELLSAGLLTCPLNLDVWACFNC
jgi:hypothetical protein